MMKNPLMFFLTLFSLLLSCSFSAYADRLDDITRAGVVRVVVSKDSPPFSFFDSRNNAQAGYDIDMANAIAKGLNVKPQWVTANADQRIELLAANKADLIIANLTITNQRAQLMSFSLPYFRSGQKFIARKGVLTQPSDLNDLRIGVNKGTTGADVLRQKYPNAIVVMYDDTPFAFAALRNGNVQAITADDARLVGFLANVPDGQKSNFEISPFSVTREFEAVAMGKEETRLRNEINKILLNLEQSGEALKIYNRWFGPGTAVEMPRGDFKIGN